MIINVKTGNTLTGCSWSSGDLASDDDGTPGRGGVRIAAATKVFTIAPVPGVDNAEPDLPAELLLGRVGLASGRAGAGARTERPRGSGAGGRGAAG